MYIYLTAPNARVQRIHDEAYLLPRTHAGGTVAHDLNKFQDELQTERRTVSFDSYDITIRQLVDMFRDNELDISPEYQRRFVWNEERQSQLIESAFLGIPIPSLYMATNPDSTWEVVDGVQRLCTLINFCGDTDIRRRIGKEAPLVIAGLEKLESLNSTNFEELPKSIQLMFLTRPLRVTVLNDKSDQHVRFDLFERLNTGGVALTQQEIRNCLYQGPLNDHLKKQATTPSLQKAVKLKASDQENGTREEYVLRFYAYLERYEQFDHSVRDFLNDYMREMLQSGPKRKSRAAFADTFKFLEGALPTGIVRGGRVSLTPVNLYEAIAVGTALALEKRRPDVAMQKKVLSLLNDKTMKRLTTGATNSKKAVASRIHFVRDSLLAA